MPTCAVDMNWPAAFVVAGLCAGAAFGQPLVEDQKLLAGDGATNAQFGAEIAIDDSLAVIGAPRDSENGTFAGAAYVFDLNTGAELFKLLPSDAGNPFAFFGRGVAIDSGVIAVGSPGDATLGTAAGAVYLFDAATGVQLMRVTAADAMVGDELGTSVALSGGVLAAGAPFDEDGPALSTGSAYLFDVATGVQLHKLLASDGAELDTLGDSIALGGGSVVVGSLRDDGGRGSAYVFDIATGVERFKLTAADSDISDAFGTDIAVDGSIIAVSARNGDGAVMNTGTVYLFDLGTGAQLDEIFLVDGVASDNFGQQIALSDGVLVVGAGQRDIGGISNTGAAFVFDLATGDLLETLVASDGLANDFLGRGLGYAEGVVIAGAPGDDTLGSFAGSAYIFRLDPADTPCNSADLAPPFGGLTFADISLFLGAFSMADPVADLAAPFGAFTFADISAFLGAFASGCP